MVIGERGSERVSQNLLDYAIAVREQIWEDLGHVTFKRWPEYSIRTPHPTLVFGIMVDVLKLRGVKWSTIHVDRDREYPCTPTWLVKVVLEC